MPQDILVQKVRVPRFIYGTAWKEDRTADCVMAALSAGFTGLDTANQRKHYFEAQAGDAVAQALQENLVRRETLFLQTKFTYRNSQDHRLPYDEDVPPGFQAEQSFNSSLSHLGVDYLDAYILHGPAKAEGLSSSDLEVWQTMELFYQQGRVKLLGVSNFSASQLTALHDKARVKPAFVQNRCFARTGWDLQVREVCAKFDIIYQGFSLLTANADIFHQPSFQEIVVRSGMTPAQVIYQAALRMNMIILTGTTNPQHMKEALFCESFTLPPNDITRLENILTDTKNKV